MSRLTPKAFILWCYLGKNKDGFKLYLSKIDFNNWTGLSESSYRRAIDELIDNQYLIKREESANSFDFYELPKSD